MLCQVAIAARDQLQVDTYMADTGAGREPFGEWLAKHGGPKRPAGRVIVVGAGPAGLFAAAHLKVCCKFSIPYTVHCALCAGPTIHVPV